MQLGAEVEICFLFPDVSQATFQTCFTRSKQSVGRQVGTQVTQAVCKELVWGVPAVSFFSCALIQKTQLNRAVLE